MYENDYIIIILDANPVTAGHCLVISKKQVDQFQDLDEEDWLEVNKGVKKIANKLKSEFDCPRVGVIIEGYQIPHTHVHVFPIYQPGDIPPIGKTHSRLVNVIDSSLVDKLKIYEIN